MDGVGRIGVERMNDNTKDCIIILLAVIVGTSVAVFDYLDIYQFATIVYLLIISIGWAALLHVVLFWIIMLPYKKPKINYRVKITDAANVSISCSEYEFGKSIHVDIDEDIKIEMYKGQLITVKVPYGERSFSVYQHSNMKTYKKICIKNDTKLHVWSETSTDKTPFHIGISNGDDSCYDELARNTYISSIRIISLVVLIYLVITVGGFITMLS